MTAIAELPQDVTNTCAISLTEDWRDSWVAVDPLGNPIPLDGISFQTIVKGANGNTILTLSTDNGLHVILAGFATAAVVAGGSGYVVGEQISLAGGTGIAPAVLRVTGIGSGGSVASAQMVTTGFYSALPTNPVSQGSSTAVGTGAIFTLTWVNNALGYIVPQASLPSKLIPGPYTFDTIATADGQIKRVTTMTMTVS